MDIARRDAVEMKRLIEQFQSEYYRGQRPASAQRAAASQTVDRDRGALSADVEKASVPERRAEPGEVEVRFRALVQSPLRASLLRFLCARPDEAFDLEAMMQTFGRMRLDIENCVRELLAFGLAQRVAGPRRAALHVRPAREPRAARPAGRVPRAPRDRHARGPLAVRPALPRDDRPRREDARRLRVDPDRRQVGHLRADPRADRLRQGSRRADDPRAQPARHEQVPGGQHARRCPTRCSSRRSSATRRGRSPARTTASRAGSRWPTTARSSSTRSATCRSSRRPSSCACSRSAGSSGSAATRRSTSISV